MIGLDRITRRIWRFRMEETATVTIEMILMTPIMVWGFVATLQFFDAYRTEMISNKAALTIADMYSRAEHDPINSTYLNGTRSLLRYLTLAEEDPDFRVTLFHWQESKNRYRVSWSRNRGERNSHNTTTINELADRLPIMVDAERALLIETWTDYTPKYGDGIGYMVGTGLDPIEFATHVVISPRFAPTVCWNNTPEDPSAARC